MGEICSGIIQRRDKGGWIINLGRTEAILPKEEQIPREHYKRGDRVQALIIEVKKEGRGPQIVISRSHRDYTAALFRREVPEVDDGTVQIMGVARDPGSRAKVAVLSRERDVDPVGACVGVRGSRIQNIGAGTPRRTHRHCGLEPRNFDLCPQRAGSGRDFPHCGR